MASIYQNTVQNIYNLGGDCSTTTNCSGYYLYVPCVKTIMRGDDECLQFYVVDENGNVIDKSLVGDMFLTFNTAYGCQTNFTGEYQPSNSDGDSDSESEFDDLVYIHSLQTDYNANAIVIDFDNNLTPQEYYVSFDEYKDSNITSSTNLKMASVNKTPCASLLCNVFNNGHALTSTANFTLKTIKCSSNSNIHIEMIVMNETANYTLNVLINGKLYKSSFSVTKEEIDSSDSDSDYEYQTKEIDIPFSADDEDTTISIMSMESDEQYDVFIDELTVETKTISTNKGLFEFCLTSEQTAQLIRGNLKMNGWIITSDGSKYSLGCSIIANVQ